MKYEVCGSPPELLRERVMFINRVGLTNVKRHCKEHHPQFNFERNLEIVRYCAKHGYTRCATKYNISHQRVFRILVQFEKYAKEVEGGVS